MALGEYTDRRTAIYQSLVAESKSARLILDKLLPPEKCTHFWIKKTAFCSNLTRNDVEVIANLTSVKSISKPFSVHLNNFITSDTAALSSKEVSVQWGVKLIGATEVWPTATGKGIVVGSIDTGAAFEHEAIKDNWRSHKGWFNPYNGTETPVPFDSHVHGTHTIGTMVGKNGIGVAPDAQWIACLGLYGDYGTQEALLACAQFMVCPTRIDGTHPECKLGADVVNNSWGGNTEYNDWFEDVVTVWREVGIVPVFAQGNNGPSCATTGTPGSYTRVLTVGAVGSFTNNPNQLAFFSSKGPSIRTEDDETIETIKPDISAPGFFTLSADSKNNTSYIKLAGTSMAAPHVAGVVALLKSAQRDLTYDEIYDLITATADQEELEEEPEIWFFPNGTEISPGGFDCGDVSDLSWPNNRYGYGRVNVASIFKDWCQRNTTSA